jgi:hypothetical protein
MSKRDTQLFWPTIVGAANQWSSHEVIVSRDVLKSLIYTASPNMKFVREI